MLAARAARPHHLDVEVLGADLDLHLVRLGHDADGRHRRVDAALRLGLGHPLDAVPAALEAEGLEDAVALDAERHFLVAAGLAFAGGDFVEAPALDAGVPGVHLVQAAGEQRGFVPAGAGADFDDDAVEVFERIDEQQVFEFQPEGVAARPEVGEFFLGHRAELGVGLFGENLLTAGDGRFEVLQFEVRLDEFRQRPVLFRGLRELDRVVDDGGVAEHLFDLAEPRELRFHRTHTRSPLHFGF